MKTTLDIDPDLLAEAQQTAAQIGKPLASVVEGCLRSHQVIDEINAAQDHLIAAKLRRDPGVLVLARRNLRRWMSRDGPNVRPVFGEWHSILHRLTRAEIAHFLLSDTPMARRLRQSTPFAGALTDTERVAIRRAHEKTGT